MRLIALALPFLLLAQTAASAEEHHPSYDLACSVLNDRPDWVDLMERTQTRWGVSVEAQLALFSEEWQLEADELPARWRPGWSISGRGEPGIPAGYFDATWARYKHETSNRSASVSSMEDISDFIGWYFASASEYVNIAPGDAAAFYITWRRGPEYLSSGAWRSNTGLIYRSRSFAESAAQIAEGLHNCEQETDDAGLLDRASRALRPWSWHHRHSPGGEWVEALHN